MTTLTQPTKPTSMLGSLATMVSTTANTVTGTVGAIGDYASMLNAHAAKAKRTQARAYKISEKSELSNMKLAAAKQQFLLQQETKAMLSQAGPDAAAEFQSILSSFDELFETE